MQIVPALPHKRLRLEVSAHLLAAGLAVLLAADLLGRSLGLPGWYELASFSTFLIVALLACWRLTDHGRLHRRWGHANRVTLLRGSLIALFGGALPLAPMLGERQSWVLVVIAVTALVLDGVDGWLARRQGLASPYGARFDMELDAFLILLLSLLLYLTDKAGLWVLGLGLMRHLFILAGLVWPVLTRPLPPSRRRQIICVIQVAVLAAAASPWIEPPLSGVATGAALALLLFSFAVDTVWLIRHGRRADGMEHG